MENKNFFIALVLNLLKEGFRVRFNPSTSSGRAQRGLNAVFTAELVEVSG